ncbi:MAG: hypothetical protein MUF64_16585 [Polyangiaceae bacterium]|jgi:hypothetical protein|nr:hypothetical protein [Polyangiaceae bacterium]
MDSQEARTRRAAVRRETWLVEPLDSDDSAASPSSLRERLERLERLRRIAFALTRIDYPEQPTPREQRERWPLRRIS